MTVALILAAGSGERLGAQRPKGLVELAGRPMLQWSIDALRRTAAVGEIVVALPPGAQAPPGVVAVEGGASRSESVRRALAAAAGTETIVLVHDAARPLLTPQLAEAVLGALLADAGAGAAIAAAPVTDTIKRASREGGAVRETLDRDELWSVQTPQVFRREQLEQALSAPAEQLASATDDASLIERAGGRVIVVPTLAPNLKVTTPVDLQLAGLLLAARGSDEPPDPA
jgi:2-C-methyl-D-erythritol 4-phosphate cytidylyltransferase